MVSAKEPAQCPATGCKRPGDPFCQDHLERMPYAIYLMGELAEIEAEVARARDGNWLEIDVNGKAAQEFLRVIREKGRPTLVRVSLECFARTDGTKSGEIYTAIGTAYAKALQKAGLLQTAIDARGKVIVYALSQRRRRRRS